MSRTKAPIETNFPQGWEQREHQYGRSRLLSEGAQTDGWDDISQTINAEAVLNYYFIFQINMSLIQSWHQSAPIDLRWYAVHSQSTAARQHRLALYLKFTATYT